MKGLLILVLCVVLVVFVLGCAENVEPDPREKEVVQLVVHEEFDKAISKAKQLYEGQELNEMIDWINSYRKKVDEHNQWINEQYDEMYPSRKLEIQPGSSYEIRGDYVYITGSVKNVSNSAISYFEVIVKILDESGQVVDSDYTNDGLKLEPGEMRSFEIMHRWSADFSEYVLEIGDVK